MREAIDLLRRTARFFRFGPGSNVDDRFVAHEHDRAADLLEALSNPPETVEELRERATRMGVHCWAEEDRASDDPACWGVEVRANGLDIYITDRTMPECVRAAWFAIVGGSGCSAPPRDVRFPYAHRTDLPAHERQISREALRQLHAGLAAARAGRIRRPSRLVRRRRDVEVGR